MENVKATQAAAFFLSSIQHMTCKQVGGFDIISGKNVSKETIKSLKVYST